MLRQQFQALWTFLTLIFRNYQQDGCQNTAAALTYQTLFAAVPLLTITYTVLASFEAFEGLGDLLQRFLFENVVPENVSVVEGYLQDFSDQTRRLSVPSLVVVAVTAFLMMFTIEKSFNEIWRIQEPRHGFQRILMYWTILTLGPPLVAGGLAITFYLASLPFFSDAAVTSEFLLLIPLMLNMLVFTLMYTAIPNCVVPIRYAVLGGAFVAVVFELVKQLFGEVMAQTDFAVIYGTYAAVPLFLIWLYLSWAIVLFGAELTKGMGLYRSQASKKLEPPLVQVLIILQEMFQCHRRGEVMTEFKMSRFGRRIDMRAWHDYKSRLLALGLIRSVERGGLVLSRDLNELTLWELYRSLPWPLPEGFVRPEDGWEKHLHLELQQHSASGQQRLQRNLESMFRGQGDAMDTEPVLSNSQSSKKDTNENS